MAAETSVDAKVPVYLALTKVNTINSETSVDAKVPVYLALTKVNTINSD